MQQVNVPAKVRLAIYIITGVLSLVIGYLQFKEYIGEAEVALWTGIAALVNGLSASNVNVSDDTTDLN